MIYVVQPGDTMYTIALKYNTSLNKLIEYNPELVNPSVIYPGQYITLPPTEYSYKLCPILRQGDRGIDVSRVQYLLKSAGFYNGLIDGIYGPLTQNALVNWQRNIREFEVTGIVDPDTWTSLGFQCEVRPKLAQYIVRQGSSLYEIAIWFRLTVQDILKVNPQLTNPNFIYKGQVINIPVGE